MTFPARASVTLLSPLCQGTCGAWTDGCSHKSLSGMSSCSDVAAHLICSFETSSCHLIGKIFRPPLELCVKGELLGLSSAYKTAGWSVTELLYLLTCMCWLAQPCSGLVWCKELRDLLQQIWHHVEPLAPRSLPQTDLQIGLCTPLTEISQQLLVGLPWNLVAEFST